MLETRRFPHVVFRRRYAVGYDLQDRPVNTATDTIFAASVQPVGSERDLRPEGVRLSDKLRVYIPQPGVLRGVENGMPSDDLVVDGNLYSVGDFISFSGSHTTANVERKGT